MADDHPIFREGIKAILSPIDEIKVVGEASDGDQVSKLLRKGGWNFLLLDIAMPGKNILDIIKQSKMQFPQHPILVLSGYEEKEYALRVFRAGANGYLSKNLAPTLLVTAIKKLAKGGKYISQELAEHLLDELHLDKPKGLHSHLTNREFQVFMGIAKGLSLQEIASNLNLSAKTISTFRIRMLKKMQMSKNIEIIQYSLVNKL